MRDNPLKRGAMGWKRWIALFLLSLAVPSIATIWVRTPGYMDADYYFANSIQISSGAGFSEPFIWNYLDSPTTVPHPSHLYWMPMASIVAAVPQALLGNGFQNAQYGFLLITAAVPLLTVLLALQLGLSADQSFFAGLLAIFSGFFFPFAVTTDTFSMYMIIGGLFFVVLVSASKNRRRFLWFLCGMLVGVAHLTRADGILFFGIALIAIFEASQSRIRFAVALLLGYLVTMAAWWIHNWMAVGTLMSPGSLRVLWLASYDELFSFPADTLTPGHLWSQGLSSILKIRFSSLLTDLQSLIVVNGLIFLGPLMLLGAYELRRKRLVRYSFFYILTLLALMSAVFPFAGARGGFFHSSAAVMPVLWSLAPIGLRQVIKFGVEKRGWEALSALKVFRAASVLLAAATTIGLFYFRSIGPDLGNPLWAKSDSAYREVGGWFRINDSENEMIAINNPPGLFVNSGLSSVVIPDGGPDELQRVIQAFGVEWLVLDRNNPGLGELYDHPGSIPWLGLQTRIPMDVSGDILIFRVDLEGNGP